MTSPATSGLGMKRLTLTQQLALNGVRVGDFILVESDAFHRTPQLILVDSITSTSRDLIRIVARAKYEIDPSNLFDYQRYGTWNLQCMSWDWPTSNILEDLLTPSDILTLNPTIDMLKTKFMGGICLYPNCMEGLTRKSPMTVNDVHFRETEIRAGREVWTLCPFCMGHELQARHECLVTSPHPERYARGVMLAHLQTVNAMRAKLGYNPLPNGVDLVVLDGLYTQSASGQSQPPSPIVDPTPERRIPRRFRVPRPIQSRHSSREPRDTSHWSAGPRLSSHSLKWFQAAAERVLNDVCGLCQEDYQQGERIVDLACQHFYHETCLHKCFEVQREAGRTEACPLCRRKVLSANFDR